MGVADDTEVIRNPCALLVRRDSFALHKVSEIVVDAVGAVVRDS